MLEVPSTPAKLEKEGKELKRRFGHPMQEKAFLGAGSDWHSPLCLHRPVASQTDGRMVSRFRGELLGLGGGGQHLAFNVAASMENI